MQGEAYIKVSPEREACSEKGRSRPGGTCQDVYKALQGFTGDYHGKGISGTASSKEGYRQEENSSRSGGT